jgi:Flp pilus assembly protein TadD
MPKVFISYRRDDSAGVAGRLYDRLQSQFGRENVFLDVDTIPPGLDFRVYLRSAVDRCDVFLVVIGRHWLSPAPEGVRRLDDPEDFARIEIEAALARGIPVIPILVDKVRMPSGSDLPPSLSALTYRNAIEVDHGRDFHSHVDRLIGSIQILSNARIPPSRPDTEYPDPHPTDRPDSATDFLDRGIVRQGLGDVGGAIADRDAAPPIEPRHAEADAGRGADRRPEGDVDRPTVDYSALRADPKNAKIFADRGGTRWQIGDFDGAIADYDTALFINPKLVSAYVDRGFARWLKGDVDGAIADYHAAVSIEPQLTPRIEPQLALAYINRGAARWADGDARGAIADYDAALRINPKLASAYANRGRARRFNGDINGAITDFAKSVELEPNNKDFRRQLEIARNLRE